MTFKKGDIIKYCNDLFEVDENYGNGGVVWEVNDNYERTGVKDTNFYWSAYGSDCELVISKVK